MANETTTRGNWNTKIGFILAAAGSAVGLGNIWRFPYVAGEGGGGLFVLIYLFFVIFISVPYLYAELSLGRHTQRNPFGAFKSITGNSLWKYVGGFFILIALIFLSYYSVIAGWAVGYIARDVIAADMGFGEFIADWTLVLPLMAIFMAVTAYVVTGGISQGIERWVKLLMPILVILMIIIIIRSVTLEGASEGIAFYLSPDFSALSGGVVMTAMGQAFFSLSLGMGAMITYGSYLKKNENLVSAGGYVAFFDTTIAIMAGFMIFPAVFAMGMDPQEGPTLVFSVLPQVFGGMTLGGLVGILFFTLLSIGALTSSISLLEIVVSYFIDERKWSRKKSVITIGILAFTIGIPSALSQGAVSWLSDMSWLFGDEGILGLGPNNFLDVMDYFFGSLFLAIGAFLACLYVGWVWGADKAVLEVKQGSAITAKLMSFWIFMIRYICPLVIFVSLVFMVYGQLG